MAQQPSWAKEGLVDVGGFAVDGADDLEAEEVGEHAIGEIEDGADLFAIVGTTRHESGVGILQDDDELHVGITATLFRPKADEVGVGKHAHGRWWDEVEAMRLFEHAHEMAQIGGLARSRRAFKNGEAVIAAAKPCDEFLVPFPASLAVVEAEDVLFEDGFGSEQDEFTADFAARPDEIKAPSPWSGWLAVIPAKF